MWTNDFNGTDRKMYWSRPELTSAINVGMLMHVCVLAPMNDPVHRDSRSVLSRSFCAVFILHAVCKVHLSHFAPQRSM